MNLKEQIAELEERITGLINAFEEDTDFIITRVSIGRSMAKISEETDNKVVVESGKPFVYLDFTRGNLFKS